MMKIAHLFPCPDNLRGGLLHYPLILGRELSALSHVETFSLPSFSLRSAAGLAREIRARGCTSAILEYTPNLYGWANLFPCLLLKKLRSMGICTLTVFHEIFLPDYPSLSGKLVMRPVNYLKDRRVLRHTEVPVVTFGHRAQEIRARFQRECAVLPVFSNVPPYEGPAVAKTHVLGSFGTAHHDLVLEPMVNAARLLGVKMLFIGEGFGGRVPPDSAEATGFLPLADLPAALQRMKYFILCDKRGISFRKGGAAAALMSGLPVVANRTEWTDPEFRHGENVFIHDGSAEGIAAAVRALEASPELAARIATGGQNLYRNHMAPGRTAARMLELLAGAPCA